MIQINEDVIRSRYIMLWQAVTNAKREGMRLRDFMAVVCIAWRFVK